MNTLRISVTGLLLIAFAMNIIGTAQDDKMSPDELVDDIEEYNGSMGPDNVFYGLKLAFERLDESFTFNETEKLDKKVYHSKLRISEAKTELKKENNKGANKAFENYKEKINETEISISGILGNDSGIINAQKMIEKHQYVLERLLESHPNNTGLKSAYNNSVELEDKFEEKTRRKLERVQTKEGKHYIKEGNLTRGYIVDVQEIKSIQDKKDINQGEMEKKFEETSDNKPEDHNERQERNDKRED
ncbi:MAG: hypothetical protein FIB07_05555 [Candidatus Methanoperedens sp.]|nr:hypothetical protein [Candidatus Methanoperedens sp.]